MCTLLWAEAKRLTGKLGEIPAANSGKVPKNFQISRSIRIFSFSRVRVSRKKRW